MFMMEAWHPTHHITSSPLGDVMVVTASAKLNRSKRQARIRTRKRQYGDRVLTFAEIGKIVSKVRFINLVGRQFGLLTVESYQGTRPQGHGTVRLWLCRCRCGKTIVTQTSSLLAGHTKSCGCSRRGKHFRNLLHSRFSMLTVVGYSGVGYDSRGKTGRLWRCKCDCGEFIITRANSLLMGKTRSCGCLRRDKASARFRTLHFLERQLGKDSMAGFERLSGMTYATTILKNALGSLPKQS
jgi:hypothetical protein